MRWFISYPILAAGLAFGVETVFPSAPDVSQPAVESAVAFPPSAAPDVVLASEAEAAPASRLAAFSPGGNFVVPESSGSSVLDYLARKLAPLDLVPVAAVDPAPLLPVTVTTWKSAVVRVEPSAAPTPAKSEPLSRVALARDIQRELQRVGCYAGEIDGVWGGGSKRAILVFMDRVNASLPTREPDVFMLSLLRGQSEAVCGAACPHGQSLTASGRCLPTTLMAQAGSARGRMEPSSSEASPSEISPKRGAPALVAEAAPVLVTGALPARRPPMPFGRMSIGGPRPADVEALSSDWPTSTTMPLERQAALDKTAVLDGSLAAIEPDAAAPTSFDTDLAPPAPVRKAKASASKPRTASRAAPRRNSYRHVQRLFEHPLGRM
jgi:hypothetical protein